MLADTGPVDDDAPIKAALEKLGGLIEERVRRERLRDQLTGLPNDLALTEMLEEHVTSGQAFWVAFVEVDKFKSVNDTFGYENADLLLKELGRVMSELCRAFGERARAFRAHGDEFFFAGSDSDPGPLRADVLTQHLELARRKIAEISLEASDAGGQMACTVSIGWLIADDLSGVVSVRGIRDRLERAVDAAKQDRNCVVRYASAMERRATTAYRADCKGCRTKFALDVPSDAEGHEGVLHCPHCHREVLRPPRPTETRPPKAEPAKV